MCRSISSRCMALCATPSQSAQLLQVVIRVLDLPEARGGGLGLLRALRGGAIRVVLRSEAAEGGLDLFVGRLLREAQGRVLLAAAAQLQRRDLPQLFLAEVEPGHDPLQRVALGAAE